MKYRSMSATFDGTGDYRYRLDRRWNRDGDRITFILLNPSTADAFKDDPTIRRCVGFAQGWNAGTVTVVNLFAYRSTIPEQLYRACDPVGEDNDQHIREAVTDVSCVVAAWGNHGAFKGRCEEVIESMRIADVKLHCFGLNKTGQPKHPLYLAEFSHLIPFGREPQP